MGFDFDLISLILGIGAGLVPAGILLLVIFKERAERRRAHETAEEIIKKANKDAESNRKEAEVAQKEELFRKREKLEQEIQDEQKRLQQIEARLDKREDSFERKFELLNKKEYHMENLDKKLQERQKTLRQSEEELHTLMDEEKKKLLEIAGLGQEEAEKLLLTRLDKELEAESGNIIKKFNEKLDEEKNRMAQEVIATAIQRIAAPHTSEIVVSTIDIPSDEMKGRIIGREGRNIRAFEKSTGVDVIVDDTPGVIVISGFDSVRREMARRAMEKLITDGRIHPTRIEEVVATTKKEMNELIQEIGKQASYEADVRGLHAKEITLLGRLKYRTSYGQNVLQHSIEVAYLGGIIAGELGLDTKLARRCGLLHDIGKAADHEIEGGHPAIGADLAKRYREKPLVVNAIAAHHEDEEPQSIYAVITQAADAVSASRPGARRETLERYIKRLERLEAVATAFEGVVGAYAIQAGREIRVIVNPDRIKDDAAHKIARDIAKQIEEELTYPGEVKVTLIRETRVTEYAR
ncbi:MAG: ribonuclease Y [Planctomycetota bacterium]|nr:MAG: ribonuclease Y [Planctomycetota bacterium]